MITVRYIIFIVNFVVLSVPQVRRHLRKQGLDTNAVLLLDNCPAHPPAEVLTSNDGKIKALFLPKNTTSKIQPLDQGIIQNVKMNYRKALMKRILEESYTIPESLKKIDLKTTFDLLGEAWDEVKPSSIENCWTHALKEAFNQEVQEDQEENDDDFLGFSAAEVKEAERRLCDHLGVPVKFASAIADWALADMEEPIAEPLSLDDIVQEDQHPAENEEDQPEPAPAPAPEPEAEDFIPIVPSASKAAWHLQQALLHMETNPEVDDLELTQLRSIIANAKRRARPKQSKLTDFFMASAIRDWWIITIQRHSVVWYST